MQLHVLDVAEGERLAERCCRAKPGWCLTVLERTGADRVTYLDADQRFYAPPALALDGLGAAAVGVLPHRFRPEHAARAALWGRFNASWVTFSADADGLAALAWWRSRCEDVAAPHGPLGRFSDQVFVDQLPQRFDRVQAIEHAGAGRAPWEEHTIVSGDAGLEVDGAPLVSFHFQSLRIRRGRRSGAPAWRVARAYEIDERERVLLWRPYAKEVAAELDASELAPTSLREALRDWREHWWQRAKDRGWH